MNMETGHQEIMRAIGNLEGKVDAINKRLDISNGRTAKNEDRIASLAVDSAVGKTKFGFIAAGAGLLASGIFKLIFK